MKCQFFYYSWTLQPREGVLCHRTEGLAVIAAVDHFSLYQLTQPFLIKTDHQALEFLNSANQKNGWHVCDVVQSFTFTFCYQPGSQNANTDALSWLTEMADCSHDGLLAYRGGRRSQTLSTLHYTFTQG